MTATHPCHTCGEPIPPEDKPMAASFKGKLYQVCEDCGLGIRSGTEVLHREGVSGEYLGPCGDNFDITKP